MKSILFSLFLALFPASFQAQVRIETDRPDQTECSSVVPAATLQLETGYVFEEDKRAGFDRRTHYFPVTLFCELRLLIQHLKKKLPLIRIPVQLIQAQEDDMTSVKNSQFIHDKIHSPVKEIFLLHNSYHVITADQERETVAVKMNEFFSRIKNNGAVMKEEAGKGLENVFA